MTTAKFKYWEEDFWYVGHFLDYPDYWTQGATLDDLKEHLRDLYGDIVVLQLQ